MNIANTLTLLRILISPLFLLIYVEHSFFKISLQALPYILLFFFTLAELSDAFDGYLARKYNQVTDLGKILDPMADSLSHMAMFLTFTQEPVKLHPLLIFVFLYRDFVVSTLRTICALRGFALAARQSGKIKAVVQASVVFIIIMLLIPYSLGYLTISSLQKTSNLLVLCAGIYTLYSGMDYIYANLTHIKKMFFSPPTR